MKHEAPARQREHEEDGLSASASASASQDAAFYRALSARDRRFDGLFFVGVSSTGIYCRPVCPARTPRADRCRFFEHRSLAEQAGFRPCLRCRPEHAPGRGETESLSRLARAAARALDAGFLDRESESALAAQLTVSTRHLRRAFRAELGVSPLAWAQERRLALARSLVMDTCLPLTEVAFAAGYSSLRRFNDAFVKQLGRPPSAWRREVARARLAQGTSARLAQGTFALRLDYRPPLPWALMMALAQRKAVRGVEQVEGVRYSRTVELGGSRGWLALEPEGTRPTLRLTVSLSLLPVLRDVVRRVRQQWDLDARPDVIEAHLARFAPLRRGLAERTGLRQVGSWDVFEGSVRIVLGQQSSVAAAATLATRLAERAGARFTDGPEGLTRFFPTAKVLASWDTAEIAAIGLPAARAAALGALARAGSASLSAESTALPALAGIGPWSQALFALRVARDPDTFPAEDLVLRRVLGLDAVAARKVAEAWRPWRSYAAVHLWAQAAGGGEQ